MVRKHLILAALAWPAAAAAVDFGVMETADPIGRGDWKFIAYPLVIRAYPSQEQRNGVNVGFGYGASEHWDVELQFANYDDESLVGADVEFILRNGDHFDASISAAAHFGETDFGNLTGFGSTAIASYTLPGTWLTLNGALDFSVDRYDFTRSGQARFGTRSDELHLVPGLQLRVSRRVDLLGEVGIGISDDARDYAALGLSFYFAHERLPRR